MIDKILENIILEECPGDEVAILLSGGVDSSTLLFSAKRLGKKVHGYSLGIVKTAAQRESEITSS